MPRSHFSINPFISNEVIKGAAVGIKLGRKTQAARKNVVNKVKRVVLKAPKVSQKSGIKIIVRPKSIVSGLKKGLKVGANSVGRIISR